MTSVFGLAGCRAPDPTTSALVARMSDTDALARFPDPPAKVTLHGSWDRAQLRE